MVAKSTLSKIAKIFSKKPEKEPRYVFSEETKLTVLRVQRYRCAVYGCRFRNWKLLEFDHIRGRSNNSIVNCQALCPTHHRLKTKRDALKARIEKEKSKRSTTKKL